MGISEAGRQMGERIELIRNNFRQALANGNGTIPGWVIGYRDPSDYERQFGFLVAQTGFPGYQEMLLGIGQINKRDVENLGERRYVALDLEKLTSDPISHVNERLVETVAQEIERLTFYTDWIY